MIKGQIPMTKPAREVFLTTGELREGAWTLVIGFWELIEHWDLDIDHCGVRRA